MKLKKLVCTGLAAVLMAASMTGCGGNGGGNNTSVDESQTTVIKVFNYDSGYGREYLEKTAAAFQEKVKDKSYETGKKGVYIDFSHMTTNATGTILLDTLASDKEHDIFVTSEFSNAQLKQNGYVENIYDLLTKTKADNQFADEKSILDRMMPDFKNYCLTGEEIYNVPLFMNIFNWVVDYGLLESKGLYIKDGSTDSNVMLTGSASELSAGPDGEKGTWDDGFPDTYAQFYTWCNEISEYATPFCWAGQFPIHVTFVMEQFWADFEGVDGVKACYDLDGTRTLTDLVDTVDDNGNVTYLPATAINLDNGYLVQKQEGRLRALEVIKKIVDNNWAASDISWANINHRDAQGKYINSSVKNQPVAMFADGAYWESEATSYFNELASKKSGKMDRKFGLLPTPKYARSEVGTKKATLAMSMGGSMFIRKGVEASRKQAVEDFFLYFNSAEAMALQNKESAQPRPYEYDFSSVSSQASFYVNNVYDVFHNDKINYVFTSAKNDFAVANKENLNHYNYFLKGNYNSNLTSDSPVQTFHDNKNVTVKQYFEGLSSYLTASRWETYKRNAGL